MPGIDLSTVSGPDLRRLLKAAHMRHEGLLADQVEWEIAARRAPGAPRPTPGFRRLADDEREAPEVQAAAPEAPPAAPPAAPSNAPPFAPPYDAPTSAPGRSVLLVTVGAVAGSLISATVFWGVGRMQAQPSPPSAAPQPSMGTAAPSADRLASAQPQALAPPAQLLAAAPTPAVTVARDAGPTRQAALKRTAKIEQAARAERPARPPTLTEWLADPPPAQRADPEEPIH